MTTGELESAIGAYGAGLEAEVLLLRQLERLADEEQQAIGREDLDEVSRLSDARDRAMTSLLGVETGIRPLREQLARHRVEASSLNGFAEVAALHRLASRLVDTILTADQATFRALERAAAARRAAAQALESGNHTLAAYRRVIAPPADNATLVNRRG